MMLASWPMGLANAERGQLGDIPIGKDCLYLLNELKGAPNVTLFRGKGNIGDELILAGTRRFLNNIPHCEASVSDVSTISGHTALIVGSGGWSIPYHSQFPAVLPLIEERFDRVIILPSSYDMREGIVRDSLSKTKALVFAREVQSYESIRRVCDARVSHDFSFHYCYAPYAKAGSGYLLAFREDIDSTLSRIPPGNNDISRRCFSLDHWLWTIAGYDLIFTDRAHVMVAAACLGKRVLYRQNGYHKVLAMADYSLRNFSKVKPID